MFGWFLRHMGLRLAGKAIRKRAHVPGLDIRLGFSLFRDGRVPAGRKLLALLLGAAAMAVLVTLEAPIEALLALVLNVAGVGIDVAIDGLETVVGTLVLGSLFVIRLAPAHLVARLQAERAATLTPGV